MPRSIIISTKAINKTFIGFYNGLITSDEFELLKKEITTKKIDSFFKSIEKWSKKNDNKWYLSIIAILSLFLIIRYNKFAIPFIGMLLAMLPALINSEYSNPEYFAQFTNGNVTIKIPKK